MLKSQHFFKKKRGGGGGKLREVSDTYMQQTLTGSVPTHCTSCNAQTRHMIPPLRGTRRDQCCEHGG